MDLELLAIFAFVLSMLIVILTFGTIAGQRNRQHKLEKLEIEARIEEAKAAQLSGQRRADTVLEDRVRVLERIVTDSVTGSKSDLAAQIEDLRREERAQ